MKDIYISGFADEISSSFDEQLKTVRELGMQYISLRSADKKGIADFTVEEVKTDLLPRLQAAGVGVSSLGSPIGKVKIDDEEGFEKQCAQLETLCEIAKVLNCKYIRMFSFFMPEGKDPADYRDAVIEKLRKFIAIAEKHDVILMHENEKDIYGDVLSRCVDLMQTLSSAHFKSLQTLYSAARIPPSAGMLSVRTLYISTSRMPFLPTRRMCSAVPVRERFLSCCTRPSWRRVIPAS